MKPKDFQSIVGNLRYDTTKSILLAGDDIKRGRQYENEDNSQNFLYRSANGRYFKIAQIAQVGGPRLRLVPLTTDEALGAWGAMENRRVEFETAFPGVEILDA